MDGSEAGAGPGREERLWDHRHVDDDSVSFLNSARFQHERHFAGGFVGLAQRPGALLVDHVGHPDQSLLVCVGRQVAVKHVVGNVDFPIGVPFSEGRLVSVEDGGRLFEPSHMVGLFSPILLSQLGAGSPSEGLFVSVLSHKSSS